MGISECVVLGLWIWCGLAWNATTLNVQAKWFSFMVASIVTASLSI